MNNELKNLTRREWALGQAMRNNTLSTITAIALAAEFEKFYTDGRRAVELAMMKHEANTDAILERVRRFREYLYPDDDVL